MPDLKQNNNKKTQQQQQQTNKSLTTALLGWMQHQPVKLTAKYDSSFQFYTETQNG